MLFLALKTHYLEVCNMYNTSRVIAMKARQQLAKGGGLHPPSLVMTGETMTISSFAQMTVEREASMR